MRSKFYYNATISALAASALLAACGGGGSAAPSVAPTAVPTPVPSASSGPVTAQGTLVDHDTGAPLGGVAVGIAPWIAGATPVPQPTTDANGNFTVAVSAPGKYLLFIGSDLAADPNNRPTIHEAITLTGGASPQHLVAPTMPPVPSTTPNPIEQSGNFRLTTLTANEQSCLTIENQKRANLGYAAVVPDEWLAENMRMVVEQEVNSNTVGGDGVLTSYNQLNGGGCFIITSDDYSSADNLSSSQLSWYGGDEESSTNGAVEEGMFDPRAVLPTPESSPWP